MTDAVADEYNVVFLVLDSLRKDRVSAYNEAIEFTENIQAIADTAVRFDDAVTQAPWTLPSHASMFTGEYPWEHGTTHARSYFPAGKSTFVSEFGDAGYSTAAITSNVWITPHKGMTGDFGCVENFLGGADNRLSRRLSKAATKLYDALGTLPKRILGRQLDRAFRLFDVDDSCKSAETVAAVEAYLGERDADERFFLYVNLMEPHEPYYPPQRYLDEHGVTDESKIPHRQKDMFTKNDTDFDELARAYDASVDYTDDLVGRITDALAANKLDEETVVVVLSDHGQALGENGVFGHQFTVMDPVIDTVLLVDHPEMDARTETRPFELRALHELMPAYAGLQSMPDDPFAETIRGGFEFPENFTGYIPREEWDEYYRQYRYLIHDGTKVVKSVADGGEPRYAGRDRETGESVPVPTDLRTAIDRIETVDVAGEDADQPAEADEEITDRLEALGYR
jgi:arylsulfatase A-like enzyme